MSRLDDLKRTYGDTPSLPLTDEQERQRREWERLGGLAMEYPELVIPSIYREYARDPQRWIQQRQGWHPDLNDKGVV
jgi:hypothetical protein